jgi:hypothetical protein
VLGVGLGVAQGPHHELAGVHVTTATTEAEVVLVALANGVKRGLLGVVNLEAVIFGGDATSGEELGCDDLAGLFDVHLLILSSGALCAGGIAIILRLVQ